MKQKILIILFGVLAIFLGFFLSSRGNKTIPTAQPVSPTPRQSAGSPPVVILPEAPTTVSFTKNMLPDAPTSLPVYSYSPILLSFQDASSIAKRFGFSEKPLKTKSGQTTTYQWSNNINVFTFDTASTDAWISFSQPTGSSFSSSLIQSAEQGNEFLKKIFPQQIGQCNLQLLRTSKGPFDGIVSTDTLTGYYFGCATPNQNSIVTNTFNDTLASLVVGQGGILRSLSLGSLFAIKETVEHPILSPEEAISHMKEDGGVLISLSRGGDFSFFDTPPQFDTISVVSYSFVYYPNTETQTLDPYYIFEGETNTTDKEVLQVKYAFPALIKD